MNEFSILFKEIDVADCYFEYEMSIIPLYEDYFTESGDSEGFFAKLKKTVSEFIQKMIDLLHELVGKFTTSQKCKKLEDDIKKDPSIANKKVKAKDYTKIRILNKKTRERLEHAKSEKEIEHIMQEYKNQRRSLISALASGAFVVISVGGLLLKIKNINENVKILKKQKEIIRNLDKKMEEQNMKNSESWKKKFASAYSETVKNESKDIVDCVKYTIIDIP